MNDQGFTESPVNAVQPPFPLDTGYIPSRPTRKLTSDTFAGFTDSHPNYGPSPGPSRRATVDSAAIPDAGVPPPIQSTEYDGVGLGANIMNGSAGFTIDKATIVGGNNIQGQPSPAIFNFYGSSGAEERARPQPWGVAANSTQREQKLNDREAQLTQWERKLKERERVVEEQERTVGQLIQSLKKLEGELQQRRFAEAVGDGSKPASQARLGGRKYVTPRLRSAFRHYAVGIDDLAHQFDFTTISLTDRAEEPAFRVPLAPHYGGLDKEQIESFPESLKVAIWSVVTSLETARTEVPFTFENVGELLTVNKNLESSGSIQYTKDDPIWFKENFKSADLSVFNEWFDTLLTDRDLQRANQTLAKVKRKGGPQDVPTSHDTKPLIDVLILWFPVNVRRSFRISRTTVKLCTTPRQGRFGIGQQKPRHFVLTEHQTSCIYHPRESFIYGVAKENRDSIVREVESFVDE